MFSENCASGANKSVGLLFAKEYITLIVCRLIVVKELEIEACESPIHASN